MNKVDKVTGKVSHYTDKIGNKATKVTDKASKYTQKADKLIGKFDGKFNKGMEYANKALDLTKKAGAVLGKVSEDGSKNGELNQWELSVEALSLNEFWQKLFGEESFVQMLGMELNDMMDFFIKALVDKLVTKLASSGLESEPVLLAIISFFDAVAKVKEWTEKNIEDNIKMAADNVRVAAEKAVASHEESMMGACGVFGGDPLGLAEGNDDLQPLGVDPRKVEFKKFEFDVDSVFEKKRREIEGCSGTSITSITVTVTNVGESAGGDSEISDTNPS